MLVLYCYGMEKNKSANNKNMAEKSEAQVAVILLAAGSSSRLGRPKQLLPYKGKTLLRHSMVQALASSAKQIIVVLGDNADILQKEITGFNIHPVMNEQWQEGMASSIRAGMNALTEMNPSVEGAILVVCDQPLMTADLLNTLIAVYRNSGKRIVACSYDDTFGPPVFFHHSFFPELFQLKGDVGARSIIRSHTENVEAVPFPEGSLDIDTEEDYERIKTDR